MRNIDDRGKKKEWQPPATPTLVSNVCRLIVEDKVVWLA